MNERLAQLYREAGLQPAWQRQPEAQPGYTPPRPRPRQMRPAIQRLYDPNQGVRDQAGAQVRQERELAALSDRAMGGYSGYADRNQVEEFGRGAMEMTGAPAWARGIQDVQNGRPGEAIPEFLWGALNTAGIATLPLGGGARPATPPRVPRDLPSRLRVYHGSPHQFDQFDAARIGSGEGAQAYGHGLYVAEADDVGQAYRQQLSGPDGGYLYEGYLSGRPSEFIDLDAPVANQPRRVQEFISELYELPIAELRRRRLRPVIVGEAEAQRAQQAGFAGLRYLDEGSRASGRGTRNYVVFDPNRVEWDVRNGALTRPPPNAANAYRVSEGSSSPANTVIAEPQLPPQVRSGPNAQALPEPIPSAVRPQLSGAGNVATPLYDAFGNQVNMGLPPLPEMGPILPELGANDRGAIERAAALLRGENTSREATYPLGVRRVFDNHGPASEGFRRIEATREQQFDFDPQNIERRRNPWPEPRLAVDNPAPDAPNAGPSRPPPRPRPPPRRPQQ